MQTHPISVLPFDRAQPRRLAVLLNMNARVVTPRIIRSIQQVVPPSDLYASCSLDDARRIAGEVLRKGYDTVLTGGGDGTFVGYLQAFREEVKQGVSSDGVLAHDLAPRSLPTLGALRLGTGNALATLSGAAPMNGGGVLEDILHVRAGRVTKTRRLDLIEVDGIAAPFAGFGYDALILNNYLKFKNLLRGTPASPLGEGLPGYTLSLAFLSIPQALVKSFPDVEVRNDGPPAFHIGDDGEPIGEPIPNGGLLYKGLARFVSAGTCPHFGFDFRVFPFAGKKPGKMHLRVASTGVVQALANLPSIWRGTWRSPSFHDFYAEQVRVTCARPMPLQVGGDAKGYRDELIMRVSPSPVELIDFNRGG